MILKVLLKNQKKYNLSKDEIQKGKVLKLINDKHGDKYKVDFPNGYSTRYQIIVNCTEHGDFKTTISNFAYLGRGCKKCSDDRLKKPLKQIINELKVKYNNIYDYSLIKSINNTKDKVIIICQNHGEFTKNLNEHISGSGCKKCFDDKKKLPFEEFIFKSNKIFNNKYQYVESSYKGTSNKLIIVCPKHGEFKQLGKTHIDGHGCLKCSNLNIDDLDNLKRDYDYSLIEKDIKTLRSKISIICNNHGIFNQTVYAHFYLKQDCPKCKNTSKGELRIEEFLLKNNIQFEKQKKFNNCKNRRALPFDFYLKELNICIEYDGIQHFKPVEYFGGENGLKITQQHDKIKNEYCSKNNIHLIRISYLDNISEKLNIIENQ